MTLQITTLPCGLRIVTDYIPHVDSVSLGFWVKAGSRYEEKHYNGAAHFLEHMAFKGTTTRTALQIVDEIESVGGYLNAYTSREMTAYYARVLKEDINLAVDILTDILQHSIFDPKEMELEREVILQEIGQSYDTPDDIIYDYFQEAAYPHQPVGWPILGPCENIKNMSRETLQQFMDKNYISKNMVLVAAGNVVHEKVCEAVGQKFTKFNENKSPTILPAQYVGGEKKEARSLEQLHMVLGYKGPSILSPEYYAADLYSSIMGGGMASRLFQEIREKRGLVYSIYSFLTTLEDTGIFGIYAGTSQKDSHTLLNVIEDELQKSTHQLNEIELNRAKRQTKAGMVFAYESPLSRAKRIAYHLLTFGRIIPFEETWDNIDAVNVDHLHDIAQKMILTPKTFAAVGPLHNIGI